jgi:pantothenate kinase-related protein Tda10
MQIPIITCSNCQGSGKTKLSMVMLRTLIAIEQLGTPTIPEIYKRLNEPKHPTALNQRIKKLLALKLIKLAPQIVCGIKRYQLV